VRPRCPAPLAIFVAALTFGSASQLMFVMADGITSGTADYTLTTTTALPAPTGPAPGSPNVSLSGTLNSGSTTVQVPSTSGLSVGYGVSGTGIASGTTISQINTNLSQVTLSQNATASGSESLVFTPTLAPPQVVALVQPAGGVVTPASTSTQGPLTILANSSGFSASGVYDYLASTKDSNGNPLQAIGLSFYGQGLAAGGVLNFSLNVANASDPPQLVSQTAGVSISLDKTSSSSSSSSTSSQTSTSVSDAQVPEPLSLLMWTALAGAGLLRARAIRRTHGA
jgi:hypothetical protein